MKKAIIGYISSAVGYVRVSTSEQALNGDSLDAQEARIRAWCAASGRDLAGIYSDAGISGAKLGNRPGVQEAVAEACRLRGVLVVYSLSRLSRSIRDAVGLLDRLRDAGADIVSLTEGFDTTTPAGKALFAMIAVFAEFERDVISERISGVMAYRKKQGLKNGGTVPYGYRLADNETGQLEPKPAEQEAIAVMKRLRGRGLSLRAIAAELERRGVTTKTGRKKWRAAVVSRILKAAA